MSVAFRRESDEEHLEPRFELPIPAGPNLVTPRGTAQIADRIADLEARIATTTDAEAEKALRRDLRYWQTRRTTAIETAPRGDGTIGFGSRVTFAMAGRERTVMLVGDDEADPAAEMLSFNAPLARVMMGAEAGDVVDFNDRDVEILAVG